MSCPFRFNHAWLKPRHPGEGAIERMALAADPTRTFAITPAEAWDKAVAEVLEWAVLHAEGIEEYRR